MANEDTEQWHLPKPLQISNPAVREAAAEMRKDLSARAVSPFARLSPQEFVRIRARARIDHLTTALLQVEQEIKTNRGANYGRQLQEARHALSARLAENLAILGNYALASEIAPNPDKAKEYAAVLAAIVGDEPQRCQCAPGRAYVKGYIYSPKHGRDMPLIACSGCGLVLVTAIPPDLARQQAHRAKALELVASMSPREAAETLKKIGHTAEKLLPR